MPEPSIISRETWMAKVKNQRLRDVNFVQYTKQMIAYWNEGAEEITKSSSLPNKWKGWNDTF